jgi:hypothetical protein
MCVSYPRNIVTIMIFLRNRKGIESDQMFYKVVHAENLTELSRLVEELLHQGWVLAGGLAFDGYFYLQAMTKD